MNYENQLKKHLEKEAQDRAALDKKWEDEKTAIRVACVEAEEIIRVVIFPEMEKLRTAIDSAGKKCTLKTSTKKIRRIDTNFEVEISLDYRVSDKLVFAADPEEKTFSITFRNSKTTSSEPYSTVGYSKITTELVTSMCERFMVTSFPV